jgi:hypothetical protein
MRKMAAEPIGQRSSEENKNSGRICTRMSAIGGKADMDQTGHDVRF